MQHDRVILAFFQVHAVVGLVMAIALAVFGGQILAGIILFLLAVVSLVGWLGVYGPVLKLPSVEDDLS